MKLPWRACFLLLLAWPVWLCLPGCGESKQKHKSNTGDRQTMNTPDPDSNAPTSPVRRELSAKASALFAAAKDGNEETVTSLLAEGQTPDPCGPGGETPLHWAHPMGTRRCLSHS